MRMSTIQSLGSSSFGMRSPLRVQECSQIDSSIIMLHANAFDRLPQVFHHPPRRPGSQISRAIIARVGTESGPLVAKIGRHSTVEVQGVRGTDVCETILKRARVLSAGRTTAHPL